MAMPRRRSKDQLRGWLVYIAAVAILIAVDLAIQPAQAETAASLGKPAPDFTLKDTEGKALSLKALRGKTVVLEWFNPDCPFVKYAHDKGPLKEFSKRVSSDKLVWLTINSNAPGKQGAGAERNIAA